MADSSRWDAVELRDGDVIVSTPSKSGTTWTQVIVDLLLHGTDPAAHGIAEPLQVRSPWVDMRTQPLDELVARLGAQTHRRIMKTHTPLDGVPIRAGVTMLCTFRHPFDVVLSDRDHSANAERARVREVLLAAGADPDDPALAGPEPPEDPAEHLRWFLDAASPPRGSGPDTLADLANQVLAAWERRDDPDVHLLHYEDLWDDLDGSMRAIAAVLGVDPDPSTWADLVEAATLDAMRARASDVVPEAHRGFWRSDVGFLAHGGRRDWSHLVDDDVVDHLRNRTTELVGADAADWLLRDRPPAAGRGQR